MRAAWDGSLARRERERDNRLARKVEAAQKEKPEERATPGGEGRSSDRASRRDRSIGSFDVVRSEEEMNAVLAQLAAEEMAAATAEMVVTRVEVSEAETVVVRLAAATAVVTMTVRSLAAAM